MLARVARKSCTRAAQLWPPETSSTFFLGALKEAAAAESLCKSSSSYRNTLFAGQAARYIASAAPKGPAMAAVTPEVLAKARKMSPWLGFIAGNFGSVVGVGGGVVIVPAIVSACKTIPQRYDTRFYT